MNMNCNSSEVINVELDKPLYEMFFLIQLLLDTNFRTVNGILGGYDIKIEEVPYQVNYGDQCGGVLIHKKWAMTTAHCGKLDFIRVGSTQRLGGPKIKISSYKVHPKFGHRHRFDFDVQLLKLYRPLHFSKAVSAIEISNGDHGGKIYLAGWGYHAEKSDYQDNLQIVELMLVPFEQCQAVKQQWFNNTLTPRLFCAGGGKKDACQGDSGGAAVSFGQLVGLSSFGYGCGRDYPGVYTNVSDPHIRKWIRHYTGL